MAFSTVSDDGKLHFVRFLERPIRLKKEKLYNIDQGCFCDFFSLGCLGSS